jgi:phage tail protein X
VLPDTISWAVEEAVPHSIGVVEAAVTGKHGLSADIPIWRDKIYLERPLLIKGDGAIVEFRRWYSQFYEGA